MKRILPLLMAALLLPALSLGAAAAGQAEIVRAFGAGETLYTYVDLGEGGQPITRAEATLDGRTFQTAGRLETVRQAGSPVSYLLMVDASTSMPGFQEDVVGFAESLAEHSGENTRFTLATFGDGFQVIGEDVAPEEVPRRQPIPSRSTGGTSSSVRLLSRFIKNGVITIAIPEAVPKTVFNTA